VQPSETSKKDAAKCRPLPGGIEILASSQVVHAGLPPGGGVVGLVLCQGGGALGRGQLLKHIGQAFGSLLGPGSRLALNVNREREKLPMCKF
jgi:hypothetical protein